MTPADTSLCTGPVHLVENHDSAYTVWRDRGVAHRILVHIDAHHDMYGGWIDEKDPNKRSRINIANFLYAALEEGLVREVIWVVPDQTWTTPAGRRDIVRTLKDLDQGVRRKKMAIQIETHCITASVLGARLRVCTAQNLPTFNEAVLLDIDVDYFIIPNVGYRGITTYGGLPWCWPDELIDRLRRGGVRSDLATIAYSVEGGYTPLQWKYLGDEAAQRLQLAPGRLEWADCMRRAAQAAARGDFSAAETNYSAARALRPDIAASRYHLAHLCAATGRSEDGRSYLSQARELDASYNSPYNNAGWWYMEMTRLEQARAAFARTLSLDPEDAYAHLGCALLAIRERQWPAAEALLRRTLDLDEDCVDAYRALGRVLAQRQGYAEAFAAYERSLQLVLSGRRALTSPATLSDTHDWRSPWDPDHGMVYVELARLNSATGASEKAITDYRMALAAGGVDAAAVWAALIPLYARLGRWRSCTIAIYRFATRTPRQAARIVQQLRILCDNALDAYRDRRRVKDPADAEAAPIMWI